MADYIITAPAKFKSQNPVVVKFSDTANSIEWQAATEVADGLTVGSSAVPNVLTLTPTGAAVDNLRLRANSNQVNLAADASLSSSYNYFFPATPPTTAGQYIIYNGVTNVFTEIHASNYLVVRKNPGPGEFSSLAAAILSIPVDPSPGFPDDTNRYVIMVYPGDYLEPALTLPSYVFVVGQYMRAVRFVANGLGFTLFTIG